MISRIFFLSLVAVACANQCVLPKISADCPAGDTDCKTAADGLDRFICNDARADCVVEEQCQTERKQVMEGIKKCLEDPSCRPDTSQGYKVAGLVDMGRRELFKVRPFQRYTEKDTRDPRRRNIQDGFFFLLPDKYAKNIIKRVEDGNHEDFCLPNPYCKGCGGGNAGIKQGIAPSLATEFLRTACASSTEGNPELSTGVTFSDAQRTAIEDILANERNITEINTVFMQGYMYQAIRQSGEYCRLIHGKGMFTQDRLLYGEKWCNVLQKSQHGLTDCRPAENCMCFGLPNEKKINTAFLTPAMALERAKAITCDLKKYVVKKLKPKVPGISCEECPGHVSATGHVDSHVQTNAGNGAPQQNAGQHNGAPTSDFNGGGPPSCPGASQNSNGPPSHPEGSWHAPSSHNYDYIYYY